MNKTIQFIFAVIIIILLAINFALVIKVKAISKNNSRRIKNLELLTQENTTSLKKQTMTQLFAEGVYLNTECVRTPTCPDGYHPEIYAQPISIGTVGASKNQPSAITNFHTFVVGKTITSPGMANEIMDCQSKQIVPCRSRKGEVLTNDDKQYWRVCMTQGLTSNAPPIDGAVAVFTQCAPNK